MLNPTQPIAPPQGQTIAPQAPSSIAKQTVAASKNKPQDATANMNDPEIVHNLEAHLNTLNPQQQKFLIDSLTKAPAMVISVLGLVCGPEVANYFTNIYTQYLSNTPQNSTGNPAQQNPTPQQPQQQQAPQAPAQTSGMMSGNQPAPPQGASPQ